MRNKGENSVEEEFRCGKRKDCMEIDGEEDALKRPKAAGSIGLAKVAALGTE